jgi:hypothetical protein
MFTVSHILVLSQPDFVQKQVCSVMKDQPCAPDSRLGSAVAEAAPAPARRKLKPRGSGLRW